MTGGAMRGWRQGLFVLAVLMAPAAVQAQGLDMQGGGPIEVVADNGIEWQQGTKRFVARGNAVATRENVSVRADTLTAWYRDDGKTADAGAPGAGGTQVYKLEAEGGVVIASPTETARGEHAVYDVDTGVMTMTSASGPVTLVTPEQTVTARDSLRYDTRARVAHATGDATVKKQDKTLRADTLVAHLREVKGKTELDVVDAEGNVVIVTPKETARGSQGKYDAKTGIATLTGSVTLTRGDDVLTGGKAVVNMNTGVSTLYGGGQAGGKARAVLVPEKDDGAAK